MFMEYGSCTCIRGLWWFCKHVEQNWRSIQDNSRFKLEDCISPIEFQSADLESKKRGKLQNQEVGATASL